VIILIRISPVQVLIFFGLFALQGGLHFLIDCFMLGLSVDGSILGTLFLIKDMLKKLDDRELKYFLLEQVPNRGPYRMVSLAQDVVSPWQDDVDGKVIHSQIQGKIVFLLTESYFVVVRFCLPKLHEMDPHVAPFSQQLV
jgi:hypothetical protein